MRQIVKFSASLLGSALLLTVLVAAEAQDAQKKHIHTRVVPKATEPKTQQTLLPQVLNKIIPGGGDSYQQAAQNNVQPNYERPEGYQNPIVNHLQFGDSESMRRAKEWLRNPATAPDYRDNPSQNSGVPVISGTPFFTGHALVPTTAADATRFVSTFGSVPTGMVLEGTASDIGAIDDVQYDAILNALVLNNQTVYFSPVAPQSLASLCRAIDQDDRIGVALGAVEIAYGQLQHDSQVAVDLKLADNFLGNITFAQSYWLPPNYPLADGYQLRSDPSPAATAVTFEFKDFRFVKAQDVLQGSGTNFEVRLMPTSDQPAPDGGALPNYDAIAQGATSPQFESNASHVAQYIEYYRREPFIDNAFRYGEAAALIRTLKEQGVDLEQLAEIIEDSTGVGALDDTPPVSDMQAPINNLFAAWKTLDLQQYIAQWSPDAQQIGQTRTSNYAEIRDTRVRLFSRLTAAGATNETILLGYRDGVATFHNQYILKYKDLDGDLHSGASCESYKVRNEGGRWLIIENQENKSC
jgi:hypothetical protein